MLDLSQPCNSVLQSPDIANSVNHIRTSRYTLWNFPFLNLFKQFHRAANVYFFIILLMQTWTKISITNGEPSMLVPLAAVLLATAVKDALEDYSRHKYDKIENNRKVEVLSHIDQTTGEQVFITSTWQALKVGSIVRLKNREWLPADIMLLSSSDAANRVAYVMTAGLDGETNLKQRQVAADVPEDLSEFADGTVLECNLPNKLLDSFDGTLNCVNSAGVTLQVPLSSKNVMLRGSQLRNSEWAIGVVAYAGPETKLQLNASKTSFKTSSYMSHVQGLMVFIFAMQCFLCAAAALYFSILQENHEDFPYLLFDEDSSSFIENFVLRFFNYMLIFTNFIPISLLVTIDFVKFGQGFSISFDQEMYHAETNRTAKVNCSELNEELGCIEHVFSDKTGTLTANIMRFKALSCNNKLFRLPELSEEEDAKKNVSCELSYSSAAEDEAEAKADRAATGKVFKSLAINHSVIPEVLESGERVYSASSPDEGALVQAAEDNGYTLLERGRKSVKVQLRDGNQVVEYPVLQSLEFTSDRKRSSIIIRDPISGKIELHCKGADNVITERLTEASRNADSSKKTFETLDELAATGLRTLCIAVREIDEDVYTSWSARFHEANISIEGRAEKMDAVQSEIETELELIGCTAIEDKLQEQVPETISMIREAGVKIWMLTGDKVDTAVNIGLSCKLWTPAMELCYLIFEDIDYDDVTKEMLQEKVSSIESTIQGTTKAASLVVDTKTIYALTQYDMIKDFLKIANRCESVICARVSPDQKAIIVKAVRDSDPGIKTLAIGDGANDVPMIQTAHVGVGIYGQEGLQAANSGDFAISRFKFLQRLLFVHGRWSARRIGILICYMFYKNVILVLPQFIFAFLCMSSGQAFYLDYPFYQGYNLFFTSFPILIFGVLDQDVSAKTSLANPQLYRDGSLRKGMARFFSPTMFWRWIGEGTMQSIIIMAVTVPTFVYGPRGISNADGSSNDIWILGALIHLCVCVTVTLRLLMENKNVTMQMGLTYLFSISFWFVCLLLWSETDTLPKLLSKSVGNAKGVVRMVESAGAWAVIFLTCTTAIAPSFVVVAYKVLFNPDKADIVRERELLLSKSKKSTAVLPAAESADGPVEKVLS